MAISQLAFVGDSLTQGTLGGFSIGLGGSGSWAELVAERLANIASVGPLISSGIRGIWLGTIASGEEWTFHGSWTLVQPTDLFDKAPYGVTGPTPTAFIQYSNGPIDIAIWTKPSQWRPVIGFAIYWIDYTNGGNWQYSIDGGTWINMNQTLANDNKLCKFYVASAVTSTVEIRCGSDAVTGVGCLPVAIEAFFSTATSGLIVHDLGVNAAKLNQLVKVTSGDRMAIFDSVKLGTGSPISNTPNAGIVLMHINDVILASTSQWATDLTTFYNRVSPLGPVGFMSPYECGNGVFDPTEQASYRSQTKSTASSLGASVYDLYDQWVANGWPNNAAAKAAGLLQADNTHETQLGHFDLAPRIYWWVRTHILSGLNANIPSLYPVSAKQASVAYIGKRPAVAPTETLPVDVSVD